VVSETVQVWLDEADQPLRVVSTLRTTGTTTRATLAFDAWGEQARIDVPTGSQVLDAETTTS
jgi:hypothetical protein